jgi:hypothetical protein
MWHDDWWRPPLLGNDLTKKFPIRVNTKYYFENLTQMRSQVLLEA